MLEHEEDVRRERSAPGRMICDKSNFDGVDRDGMGSISPEQMIYNYHTFQCSEVASVKIEDELIRRAHSDPIRHQIRPKGKLSALHGRPQVPRKVFGRVCFLASKDVPEDQDLSPYIHFVLDENICYHGFCEDFGPMNLGMVYKFCLCVDDQLQRWPQRSIVLVSDVDKKQITNAAFLLGAYMIMRLDAGPDDCVSALAPFRQQLLSFRDVSPGRQNFHLYLKDCWEGLWHAKQNALVDFGPDGFNVRRPPYDPLQLLVGPSLCGGERRPPSRRRWTNTTRSTIPSTPTCMRSPRRPACSARADFVAVNRPVPP